MPRCGRLSILVALFFSALALPGCASPLAGGGEVVAFVGADEVLDGLAMGYGPTLEEAVKSAIASCGVKLGTLAKKSGSERGRTGCRLRGDSQTHMYRCMAMVQAQEPTNDIYRGENYGQIFAIGVAGGDTEAEAVKEAMGSCRRSRGQNCKLFGSRCAK